MPATRKMNVKELGQLPGTVFTRDNGEGGMFGAPNLPSTYRQRLSFLRALAEDVEQSARQADELRTQQHKQACVDHPHASERRPERKMAVEAQERRLVREAIGLFAQVVRFTDDGVLDEEMQKVVTLRDFEAMTLALRAFGGENL